MWQETADVAPSPSLCLHFFDEALLGFFFVSLLLLQLRKEQQQQQISFFDPLFVCYQILHQFN